MHAQGNSWMLLPIPFFFVYIVFFFRARSICPRCTAAYKLTLRLLMPPVV